MKQLLLILTLSIPTLLWGQGDENLLNQYKGGRFGYSWMTLKLYLDSTYYYYEGNHTGQSIKDKGKWGKIKSMYYLNSTSKSKWKGSGGNSNEIYRFEMQKFIINSDTISFLPKNKKDTDFYRAYYTMHKVKNAIIDTLKCNVQVLVNTQEHIESLSKIQMTQFLKTFGTECKNNVEFSEFGNEILFKVIQAAPELFCTSLLTDKDEIAIDIILDELKSPINDLINLKEIIEKVKKAKMDSGMKKRILDSLNTAVEKSE